MAVASARRRSRLAGLRLEVKLADVNDAVEAGADEVDMVIDLVIVNEAARGLDDPSLFRIGSSSLLNDLLMQGR